MDGQVLIFDHYASPDRLHDRMLRHQLAAMRDEESQNVESALASRHRDETAGSILPEQAAAAPIEPEAFEQDHFVRDRHVHASLPLMIGAVSIRQVNTAGWKTPRFATRPAQRVEMSSIYFSR